MHMEKLIGEMKVLEDEESRLELEAMKEWSDLGTSVATMSSRRQLRRKTALLQGTNSVHSSIGLITPLTQRLIVMSSYCHLLGFSVGFTLSSTQFCGRHAQIL